MLLDPAGLCDSIEDEAKELLAVIRLLVSFFEDVLIVERNSQFSSGN